MRRVGSRAVSWLVVAAITSLLSPLSMSFAAQNGANTVNSAAIIAADGTSGQTLTTGNGVKSGHIQDGAVTASKLGIVCANGEYLQYVFGSGWVCSVGTVGPAGPQGPAGAIGATGPQGPAGATPHYANVIVVAQSGGDYTDPVTAVNYANSVATVDNPYLVKIMPGVYSVLQPVALNAYVNLDGAGATATIIRGTNISNGVVSASGNNTISNIRIESLADGSVSDNVALSVGSGLIEANVKHVVLSAQGGSNAYALRNNGTTLIGDDIQAYATGATTSIGIYSTDACLQINNSVAIGSSGVGVMLRNLNGGTNTPSPTFNGLVAEGNIGFKNFNSFNKPRIRNSRLTGTAYALYTEATSIDTPTYVSNSEINGATAVSGPWYGVQTAANVCAGVTDTNGVFNANSCPQ